MSNKKIKGLVKWFNVEKPLTEDNDVNCYVCEIKRKIINNGGRTIKMWLPTKMEEELRRILINDIGFDLATLKDSISGFNLYYISRVVNVCTDLDKKKVKSV